MGRDAIAVGWLQMCNGHNYVNAYWYPTNTFSQRWSYASRGVLYTGFHMGLGVGEGVPRLDSTTIDLIQVDNGLEINFKGM